MKNTREISKRRQRRMEKRRVKRKNKGHAKKKKDVAYDRTMPRGLFTRWLGRWL